MELTEKQKRHLRAKAHHLKPTVIVGGAGLTDGLLRELDLSLAHHELLKVRVNAADRDARKAAIEHLCETSGAALVQSIGHIAVLYRPADPPQIQLPR
jgi:RNA-binding protein